MSTEPELEVEVGTWWECEDGDCFPDRIVAIWHATAIWHDPSDPHGEPSTVRIRSVTYGDWEDVPAPR